jgi:hypothetical protein
MDPGNQKESTKRPVLFRDKDTTTNPSRGFSAKSVTCGSGGPLTLTETVS